MSHSIEGYEFWNTGIPSIDKYMNGVLRLPITDRLIIPARQVPAARIFCTVVLSEYKLPLDPSDSAQLSLIQLGENLKAEFPREAPGVGLEVVIARVGQLPHLKRRWWQDGFRDFEPFDLKDLRFGLLFKALSQDPDAYEAYLTREGPRVRLEDWVTANYPKLSVRPPASDTPAGQQMIQNFLDSLRDSDQGQQ